MYKFLNLLQEVDLKAAFSTVAAWSQVVLNKSPHAELMSLSVKHALINAGIPNKRIQTQAFGESHAKAKEGNLEEYIYDRRVTINLTLDREV